MRGLSQKRKQQELEQEEYERELVIEEFLIEKPSKTDLKSCLKSLNTYAYRDLSANYFEDEEFSISQLVEEITEAFKEDMNEEFIVSYFLVTPSTVISTVYSPTSTVYLPASSASTPM